MKLRLIYILFSLIYFAPVSANEPLDRFEQANQLYEDQKYAEAISEYQSLLQEEWVSDDLHYNLANAYFRNKDIARSILHYEKALKLNPAHQDAKHNLEFAYSQTIDKIENPPQLFLYRWWQNLVHLFDLDSWTYLSLIFLSLCSLSFGWYFFSSKGAMKKFSFYAAMIVLGLGLISWVIAAGQKRAIQKQSHAVILSPTIDIKSSPSEGSSRLFVLHEGTKVKLEDSSEDWLEISIPNGNSGWVKSSDLEKI